MKPLAVIALCLVAIIAYYFVSKWLQDKNDNTLTFTLVLDVAKFANQNDRKLPDSWEQFVDWYYDNEIGGMSWNKEDLDKRFALDWSASMGEPDTNKTAFVILDPSKKDIQGHANNTLRRQIVP